MGFQLGLGRLKGSGLTSPYVKARESLDRSPFEQRTKEVERSWTNKPSPHFAAALVLAAELDNNSQGQESSLQNIH